MQFMVYCSHTVVLGCIIEKNTLDAITNSADT